MVAAWAVHCLLPPQKVSAAAVGPQAELMGFADPTVGGALKGTEMVYLKQDVT